MAASLPSPSFKRRGHRYAKPLMSEINVTPFVDVMLVLLIIFMVTAPLLTVGVPVELPKTQAQPLHEKTEPLTVSVNAKGHVFIQETEVSLETLVPKLQAITEAKPDTRIYVRGDQTLAYGRIMEVMGLLTTAGFNKIALVAEMPKSSGSTPAMKRSQ
jgi:biopolymer transport protein TolR